jgi:hypothetical protein
MTDALDHRPQHNSKPADNLILFAKDFAQSKRAVLDLMPPYVVNGVTRWLDDMMAAAEVGDANRVHAIAGRIGSRLKDEMAYQLNQARKARDRQRG